MLEDETMAEPKDPVETERPETKQILKSISFYILIFILTFIGAGRIDYWQGWVFNALNIIFILLSYFLLPPELIKERLKFMRENIKKWDKIYLIISTPNSFCMLIISILDGGRFGWEPRIPISVVLFGIIMFSIGQAIVLWAKKVNKFFLSVACILEDQIVCKVGPYRFVRHPGYLGGSLYMIATPLVLGSFWGLIPATIAVILLIRRTYLEDKMLQAELPGYIGYTKEVKYRLLPKIW